MTDLMEVCDATWPAAARHQAGAFTVREGRGGGQRVSAATADGDWSAADIDAAEALHESLGQRPLFLVRAGEDRLDAALAARDYAVKDPVNIYLSTCRAITGTEAKRLTGFTLWPPLAIMRDLWADGAIGPERIAVMERAVDPKTAILGRAGDRAAGAAFVAISDNVAMLHALHIAEGLRRRGSAINMMRMAAMWAQDHGAERFSVLVTKANTAANALYASLDMQIVGQYHYRSQKP